MYIEYFFLFDYNCLMVEKTVVLIKPDGYEKKIVGVVIDRFERQGLHLVAMKMLRLNKKLLDYWYAHHKHKDFFPQLVAYMTSTPIVAMVWKGDSAIQKVFDICGPTDPLEASPGTIRKDFGDSKQKNVVHRSDSVEAAQKEIGLLFTPEELFSN